MKGSLQNIRQMWSLTTAIEAIESKLTKAIQNLISYSC